MSLQNPTIPTPTDPVEVDAAIVDIKNKLAFNLAWLTHSYGRAYVQQDTTQSRAVVFPSLYLGGQGIDFKYFNCSPDNDKAAQCFFLVDTETVLNFAQGQHNYLSYNLSIVFTANLGLVNSVLALTDKFQSNLIQEVRDVLIRELSPSFYHLRIDDVNLNFRDSYREFQLNPSTVLEKSPFVHFRLNCTLTFKEQCLASPLSRCEAIRQNITYEDLLNCLLELYDFSDPATQAALSPTQITDLQDAFCTPLPPITQYSMSFDGVNEYINCYNKAEYDFTNLQPFSMTSWVKSTNYALGVAQGVMTKRSGSGGGTGWSFYFLNGDLYVLLQINVYYIQMRTNGVTFTNNTWYHLAVTISGNSNASGVKIYRDGVQLATVTIQNNLTFSIVNSAPVNIGGENNSGKYFNGNIGYSRLFNIELSAADILADYNGGVMLEDSPQVANQVLGWKGGQGALFGVVWNFPFELDINQQSPSSGNMEIVDRTTDVP